MTFSHAHHDRATRFICKWLRPAIMWACIASSSAYAADSTFLVQLGTFTTEADAVKKWDDVKAKNADLVGNLSLHVAEVMIPPDNIVKYRTQAGPISSHTQAASLCGFLQKSGVECNVVETALFTEEASTPSAPQATTSNIAPSAAPLVAEAAQPVAVVPAAPANTENQPPVQKSSTMQWLDSLVSSKSEEKPAPAAPVAAAPMPMVPAPVESSTVAESPAAAPPAVQVVPGREMKFLDAQQPLAPSTTSDVAEAPAPAPLVLTPPASSGSSIGKVDVAEAIHVPLSSNQKKSNIKVIAQLPAVHGKGGTPSSDTSKLFWAQISYFNSEQEGRSFYADLMSAYPQFSEGVRLRVTHPYSVRRSTRVSLRVGPFATVQDVHTVCAAAHSASDTKIHCALVRELSNSGVANAVRSRGNYGTNYENRAAVNPDAAAELAAEVASSPKQTFWVQLGSYASPDMAWDSWKTLQENNKKLLKKIQASVSTPETSSASRALFRLRAGPFSSESEANALCDKLSTQGEGCIVLNDR